MALTVFLVMLAVVASFCARVALARINASERKKSILLMFREECEARSTHGAIAAALFGGWLVLWFFMPYARNYLWHNSLGLGGNYLVRLTAYFGSILLWSGVVLILMRALSMGEMKYTAARQKYATRWNEEDEMVQVVLPSEGPRTLYGVIFRVSRPLAALLVAYFLMPGSLELLQFLYAAPSQVLDPVFGKSEAFHMLRMPYISEVSSFLLWAIICSLALFLIEAMVHYVMACGEDDSMVDGAQVWNAVMAKVDSGIRRAIILFSVYLAARWFFARYEMLHEHHTRLTGLGFTELHWTLPATWVLIFLALLTAVLAALRFQKAGGVAIAVAVGLAMLEPFGGMLFHRLMVVPSEFETETPYLTRHQEATRRAFQLEKIEEREYSPRVDVKLDELKANSATLDNVALWDYRPLGAALNQTQEIRTYYEFPDIDIDRYVIDGKLRQVMLASRELDQRRLPEQSRTFNAKHMMYTHGYGVTLNEAVAFEGNGDPKLLLKDIPVKSAIPEVRVTRPEIYFGEMTTEHIYVGPKISEFDYPQGDANAENQYQGKDGVYLNSIFNRFVIAWNFDGFRTMLSSSIDNQSRILYWREVRTRVRAVAPFLTLDDDPYKVIGGDGRLYYVIDAYTTSARYPYAAEFHGVNYARNSVKAVVDAYDGTVDLYVFDTKDPILATWRKVFPGLFKDRQELRADLTKHLRYPEGLLLWQAAAYADFHMKNMKALFMREDRWEIANEQIGDDLQQMEPYFAVAKLPGEPQEEFLHMLQFTPRGKNNAAGWMAGRSDGEHYGKLLVYRLPKDHFIMGPVTFHSRLNQDENMSQDLALWTRAGANVIRGNLLVFPIEGTMLSVMPLYLQSKNSPIPELTRVVVGYNDKVTWGKTLDEALRTLFASDASSKAPLPNTSIQKTEVNPSESEASRLLDEYFTLMGQRKVEEANRALARLRDLLRNYR